MLFEVVCYNLLIFFFLGLIGFLPAKFLQKKINQSGPVFFIFSSLIFGYFLFESILAVWLTKGVTVQWLNFIPFGLLFIFPDKTTKKVAIKSDFSFLFLPLTLFFFSTWYFLKSYSFDLHSFNNYPFVDIISYATNSFAMGFSGAETSVASGTIYYPDRFRFNLYHFTELWAIVGFCKILPITETFAICFILPVFFFTLIGFGIAAIGQELKIPVYALVAIGLAVCFANGKLLFFDDVFLYSFLDLGGLKISLLFPLLILFWLLRENLPLVFAFGLFLPQTNTLHFLLLATFVGLYILLNIRKLKEKIPIAIIVGYALFAISFLFIIVKNSEGSESFPPNTLSIYQAVLEAFSYFRESIFNLGFNYWGIFILLSAFVVSWKYGLLLLPFFISKGLSKVLGALISIDYKIVPVIEVLVFIGVLTLINHKLKILSIRFFQTLTVLFFLCLYAGIGHSYTGHVDFEQIFTLFSCSIFPLMVLFLFQPKNNESGLLDFLKSDKLKWVGLSVVLIFVIFKTLRFQRSLPFETEFYNHILKAIESDKGQKFSAHFTTKKMYPFPLHVQAGFPLLFEYSTAISTTVTLLNDSSWQKTERAS